MVKAFKIVSRKSLIALLCGYRQNIGKFFVPIELKYIVQIYYYDPQSAGINVQPPQSTTTPRKLTLTYLVTI